MITYNQLDIPASYRLTGDPDWVIRDGAAHTPSTDQHYQHWLAIGNTPDPPAPPPIPTEVSAAQGRLALLQAGVLDALEAWITTQPRATQIEYAARGTWRRDWPLVAMGAEALGLTEAQLDELFILAATL